MSTTSWEKCLKMGNFRHHQERVNVTTTELIPRAEQEGGVSPLCLLHLRDQVEEMSHQISKLLQSTEALVHLLLHQQLGLVLRK